MCLLTLQSNDNTLKSENLLSPSFRICNLWQSQTGVIDGLAGSIGTTTSRDLRGNTRVNKHVSVFFPLPLDYQGGYFLCSLGAVLTLNSETAKHQHQHQLSINSWTVITTEPNYCPFTNIKTIQCCAELLFGMGSSPTAAEANLPCKGKDALLENNDLSLNWKGCRQEALSIMYLYGLLHILKQINTLLQLD